jgi:uncharacterized protein YdcH (DUF465 family)
MHIEHHPLRDEFPEKRAAIEGLAQSNSHFAHLFARYDRLTGKVEDLEEHDMPVADFTIEDMKKMRLRLKDEIWYLLLAWEAGRQAATVS